MVTGYTGIGRKSSSGARVRLCLVTQGNIYSRWCCSAANATLRSERQAEVIMAKGFKPSTSLFDLAMASLSLGAAMVQLGLDSQRVVAMRTAGMMGLRQMPQGESVRMVSEKSEAIALSARAAGAALARGETPDRVVGAALKPITRKARANVRRLSKHAPGDMRG